MALVGTSIVEINSSATASNVNGGGFNPANANMLTDLTTDTNTANTDDPIVSSASYNFVAGDVGHWVYIKSGTNWTPGWYKISAVAANKATLMAAIGEAVQTSSTVGWPTPSYNANTVAGCATVGTPTGGTFTIDYSQETAAIINNTDLACPDGDAASPTVTSAGSPFGVNHVGNFIHITAGTGYTAGWYEIVSVSGVTATLDRAIGTDGAKTGGTFYVGGAMSLNSTLDDDLFEIAVGTNGVRGMRYFIKNAGSPSTVITMGEAITTTSDGATQAPIVVEGYNTLRGDGPTGNNRPTLSLGGNNWSSGDYWHYYNLIFTGTGTAVFTNGGLGNSVNCKFINTTTSSGRDAVSMSGSSSWLEGAEVISYRADGIQQGTAGNLMVMDSYIHDCVNGVVATAGSSRYDYIHNIVADNFTIGISLTGANLHNTRVEGNSFYGAKNKLGTGLSLATGCVGTHTRNNIFYGFVTGASNADVQSSLPADYNDWYNNTNDVNDATKFIKGAHDLALDPQFTNVTQITGTGATSSTNVLTAGSGTPFANVVDDVDVLTVISGTGTGFTIGKYFITSHTSSTLTCGPGNFTSSGAGSSIVWQITQGHDFSIGTNLKAQGFPGAFPGGLTTGYTDIGAAQRQEGTSRPEFRGPNL